MAKVTMPQLGESVAEGTIGKWLKQPGDHVAKYEPLVEVITDKVNAEVPSPFEGTLREILADEGATVPNNAEIAVIETADEAGETASPTASTAASPAASPTPPAAAPMPVAAPPMPVAAPPIPVAAPPTRQTQPAMRARPACSSRSISALDRTSAGSSAGIRAPPQIEHAKRRTSLFSRSAIARQCGQRIVSLRGTPHAGQRTSVADTGLPHALQRGGAPSDGSCGGWPPVVSDMETLITAAVALALVARPVYS